MTRIFTVLRVAAALALTAAVAKAQDTTPEPLDLSFEELLDVEVRVPSAITKLRRAEAPASTTVITAEDIRGTPARNIYDLLEVYVPGATWLNYEKGPRAALRGHVANRNYKYLLLVNGRVLNNKAHYGAKSELEQWDLSDIQRIEVIRGPGSVTYGPGAVAGVINIVTHHGRTAPGLRVETRAVSAYDSVGWVTSYGHVSDAYDLYVHGSATRTYGYAAEHFDVAKDSEAGFIGRDVNRDAEPLDYFADYQDAPQLKLHLDGRFLDNWRAWARYTQQGSTWRGNEAKSDFSGAQLNQQGIQDRQATLTLQFEDDLARDARLTAMLSADSFDTEARADRVYHPDPDHPLNKRVAFAETELFARSVVNWQPSRRGELAVGAEYSLDSFGPGWGDPKEDMRLGEQGVIVSGPDSRAVAGNAPGSADRIGTAQFVGSGWTVHTVSLLAESEAQLWPWLKVLASWRLDKNSYSPALHSPRVAAISEFVDGHFLKFFAQRSLRANTAGQLLVEKRTGQDADTEALNAMELAYAAFLGERTSVHVASFYNDAEVIAWNEDINGSATVGDLELFGFEGEADYAWHRTRIGANYSWVKQLDWQLAPGVPSGGVSYADYRQPIEDPPTVIRGVGNDLNNWPNQALKVFGRVPLVEQLQLQVDARVFWDYRGGKDGITAVRRAAVGQPTEAEVLDAIARIEDEHAFEADCRLNASLAYEPLDGLVVQVLGQNLVGSNGNPRYAYDRGVNNLAPRNVRFVREPRSLWLRLTYAAH